jgi:hypothetical protein
MFAPDTTTTRVKGHVRPREGSVHLGDRALPDESRTGFPCYSRVVVDRHTPHIDTPDRGYTPSRDQEREAPAWLRVRGWWTVQGRTRFVGRPVSPETG